MKLRGNCEACIDISVESGKNLDVIEELPIKYSVFTDAYVGESC